MSTPVHNENDAEALRTTMIQLACTRPRPDQLAAMSTLHPDTVVRHVELEGVPHAYRDDWTFWDRIRRTVSSTLKISFADVHATGSGNRGYSWLKKTPFDRETSDLDVLAIAPLPFNAIESELVAAPDVYLRGKRGELLRRHLRAGFLQSHQLRRSLSSAVELRRAVWKLQQLFASAHGEHWAPNPEKASIRIYRSREAVLQQLAKSLPLQAQE